MSSLDGDTRSWLGSLVASLGQGLGGRGPDLRRMLLALGPNAEQVGRIATALAVRRHDIAHLVHDLAVVTRAASADGRLAPLVAASDQTMRALASQSGPLAAAVRLLPASLGQVDTTLVHLRSFSGRLGPSLRSLMPAVRRLPAALAALRPFASAATGVVRSRLTPFVGAATPLVRALDPAVRGLAAATPFLTSSLQVLTYIDDELAYNPGGANQGYLYWMDWFFHNWDSVFSSGDANGISPRANVLANCNALAAAGSAGTVLESVLGLGKLC
jgi:phospholipid/cholesterol/gamma-HCH transport system substrate-binding protein